MYEYIAGQVAAILAQWKTGTVTLTRPTRAAADGDTPWQPGEVTSTDTYDLDAVVKGVSADYVDGSTVLASDLMVIVSPKARKDGEMVDLIPAMGDILSIDGAAKVIKRIQPVQAAGLPVRFNIFVGS